MAKNHLLIQSRHEKKMTQQQVADVLGTTKLTVGRWERGVIVPRPYYVRGLCTLFQKTKEELGLDDHQEHHEKQLASRPLYDSAIPIMPSLWFVGRSQEIQRIKQQLIAEKNRSIALTALNGLPGVGKTTLAMMLVQDKDIRDHFSDGILWASLGPNADVQGVLQRWSHSNLLNISSSPATSMEERLQVTRRAIGEKSFLIVLDDVWRVEDALALRVGSNCGYLLTTRFPSIATRIALQNAFLLNELTEEESMKLLQARAQGAMDKIALEDVQKLIRQVGGLPLALTLIGNYFRSIAYSPSRRLVSAVHHFIDDPVHRLQFSEPQMLAQMHPSIPMESSISLGSILNITYQALSTQAQKTLNSFAVFPAKPASFSEEAAIMVSECETKYLDELLDSGFLESSGHDRYRLHQVIADYADSQLNPIQRQRLQHRLMDFVIAYVSDHEKDYALLEEESDMFHAVLSQNREHQTEKWFQVLTVLAPFFIMQGYYTLMDEYLAYAQTLLETQKISLQENNRYIMLILMYRGDIAFRLAHYDDAFSYQTQALDLAMQRKEQIFICDLKRNIGGVLWRIGDEKAKGYLEEALKLAQSLHDLDRQCSILKYLGGIEMERGNKETAEHFLQQGIELAHKTGNLQLLSVLLGNLGVVLGQVGDAHRASRYFQQSLDLAKSINERDQICITCINLGELAKNRKDYARALSYLKEALAVAQETNMQEWECIALSESAEIFTQQGHLPEAEAYLHKALSLAQQFKWNRLICSIQNQQGKFHLASKHDEEALQTFREMEKTALLSQQNKEFLGLSLFGQAQALVRRGQQEEGLQRALESQRILSGSGFASAQDVNQWLQNQKG